MKSANNQVNVFVLSTTKVADAAVILCFQADGDNQHLGKCVSCCECETDTKGSDETSVLYSMYLAAENKVKGTPLDISRNRVSQINCSFVDGHFVVYWNCHGSLTYVRKSINNVLKTMVPSYSAYEKCMKSIGLSPSREIFNHCANKITSSLKKSIHIAAIGKISLKKTIDGKSIPPQKTLDKLVSSIKTPEFKTLSPARASTKEKQNDAENTVSCSGMDAALTALYITQVSKLPVSLDCKHISIHSNTWPTHKKKLKEASKIEAYINSKYGHRSITAHINALFAYQLATSGLATALSVAQAGTQSLTVKNLCEKIKKCLKD